jgi:TolA-binding protein
VRFHRSSFPALHVQLPGLRMSFVLPSTSRSIASSAHKQAIRKLNPIHVCSRARAPDTSSRIVSRAVPQGSHECCNNAGSINVVSSSTSHAHSLYEDDNELGYALEHARNGDFITARNSFQQYLQRCPNACKAWVSYAQVGPYSASRFLLREI